MRLFFLETEVGQPAEVGQTVTLGIEESRHLLTVLRGGRDEVLNLTDGQGYLYTGQSILTGQRQKQVQVVLESRTEATAELAPPNLLLACSVVKSKRFEWALEKAVEVGVRRIVPLATEHGVIKPGQGKQSRWRTVLISALKQSGRAQLPVLEPILEFAAFLDDLPPGPVYYGTTCSDAESAGAGSPDGTPLPALLWTELSTADRQSVPENLTMLIGPEGGWSEAERRLLAESPAIPISLGPFVMRTETAAVAGLLALQAVRQQYL